MDYFGTQEERMQVSILGPQEVSFFEDFLEENSSLVVSDDIWKKFDLDLPEEFMAQHTLRNERLDDLYQFEESSFLEPSEIRQHDCMWAGLCISKEHNSTMTSVVGPTVHKKVPAGRSLLIPKSDTVSHQTTQHQQSLCRTKSLESDGDSTRPETPQSSESESESDYEAPIFRHEQVSINERLSECFPEAANPVCVTSATGQQVITPRMRIDNMYTNKEETDVRYTLSDHSYHLNQPVVSKKLEHLGVQTPSDSEEEIDVVSYEKPCRQTTVLPTFPSPADQQQFQLTVKTAFKQKPSRPRGRPPLAANARKRAAPPPPPAVAQPAKRPRRSKTHQKRSKYSDIDDIPLPPTNGIKCIPPSRSSSDDEPDTEKRSLHNNMERQRRVDLRKAFEDLRKMVPGVTNNEKAPKVAILRQAAAYCDILTNQECHRDFAIKELKDRQERLLARCNQLRRECRSSR